MLGMDQPQTVREIWKAKIDEVCSNAVLLWVGGGGGEKGNVIYPASVLILLKNISKLMISFVMSNVTE